MHQITKFKIMKKKSWKGIPYTFHNLGMNETLHTANHGCHSCNLVIFNTDNISLCPASKIDLSVSIKRQILSEGNISHVFWGVFFQKFACLHVEL